MTRINSSIHPRELPRKALLAESREIKRVPNALLSGRLKPTNIPEKFTLGKGHVKFFADKLEYLWHRYESIHCECLIRGYKVQYYGDAFEKAVEKFPNLYNWWVETEEVRQILLERLKLRNHTLIK
jgi:hypothetical protein